MKARRIQLDIPEATVKRIKGLMDEVGIRTYSELFGNALTTLEWMVRERRQGRGVVSTDSTFSEMRELSMPILDAIEPKSAPANSQQGEQRLVRKELVDRI